MLKIRKDNVEKIVSKGAYEETYKKMGYTVVPSETKKPMNFQKPSTKDSVDKTSDDDKSNKDSE